jgi:hypothetical protein
MNTIIRGELLLLLMAGALFALAALQFNGSVDIVHELKNYI